MKSFNLPIPQLENPLTAITRCAIALLTSGSSASRRELQQHRNEKSGADKRPAFELFEADDNNRTHVEEFIRRCYAENFNAHIDAFMPRLFGLRDVNGELRGAFGLRTASRRLFLEQYLQTKIEAAIAQHCTRPIERHSIVEVGHFSGSFAGAAREMIKLLTRRLREENYAWVAFTGTSELRNAFGRMGLGLIDLGAATIDKLSADSCNCWGSYYDHNPRVMAGEVGVGYKTLAQKISLADDTEDQDISRNRFA